MSHLQARTIFVCNVIVLVLRSQTFTRAHQQLVNLSSCRHYDILQKTWTSPRVHFYQ